MKKRIFILGDGKSIHLERWVKALHKDVEIGVFSFRGFTNDLENLEAIKRYSSDNDHKSWLDKFGYLKNLPSLKKAIEDFKPDILHAHYASSYGILGRLTKFHPFVISCWGSDLFEFPNISFLTKKILKRSLKKADHILVSSKSLEQELKKYSDKKPELVYFGVDSDLFYQKDEKVNDYFTLGQVKNLRDIYGIDLSFKVLSELKKRSEKKMKFLLAGDGEDKEKLKCLAEELGLQDMIEWRGHLNHKELTGFYDEVDLGIYLSRAESFGVSAIECMSKGIPVIASDAPGLSEVVLNQNTGSVLAINETNLENVVEEILKYINDRELLITHGDNARKRVLENYTWNENVQKQIDFYKGV